MVGAVGVVASPSDTAYMHLIFVYFIKSITVVITYSIGGAPGGVAGVVSCPITK